MKAKITTMPYGRSFEELDWTNGYSNEVCAKCGDLKRVKPCGIALECGALLTASFCRQCLAPGAEFDDSRPHAHVGWENNGPLQFRMVSVSFRRERNNSRERAMHDIKTRVIADARAMIQPKLSASGDTLFFNLPAEISVRYCNIPEEAVNGAPV